MRLSIAQGRGSGMSEVGVIPPMYSAVRGWLWWCLCLAPLLAGAQEKVPATAPLALLRELGLPSTVNAKWVRVESGDFEEGRQGNLPGSDESPEMGNAWLLSEEGKDKVTLLVHQTRVRKVKLLQGKEEDEEEGENGLYGEEMPVRIKPANLKTDLAALKAGLEKLAKSRQPQRERDNDYQTKDRAGAVSQALLFLAHLQSRGEKGLEAPLQQALAAVAPQYALDAAVSSLADQRLRELNERWEKGLEAATYATELEKLAEQFHRGWENRPGVLLLVKRMRESAPALHTPAATLLQTLRAADTDKLPLARNWLLPGEEKAGGDAEPNFRIVRGRVQRVSPPRKAGDPAAKGTAGAEEFFATKVPAAQALLPLLAQSMPLRLLRQPEENSYHYISSDASPEEVATASYQKIPRPYQLGELATALLTATLPERDSSFDDEEDGKAQSKIVQWIESVAGRSEEEIAWQYLRGAESASAPNFQAALSFLVKEGTPPTLAELREVFLDPAVWQEGISDALTNPLKAYMARLGAEGADFGNHLLEVLKKAKKEPVPRIPGMEVDEYQKQMAARQVQQLKQLEQVLRPRSLEALLAEFLAAPSDEERQTLVQALRVAVRTAKGGGQGPIYRAALAVPKPELKQMLLFLLAQRGGGSGGEDDEDEEDAPPEKASPKAAATPLDPEAQAALRQLMADETPLPSRGYSRETFSVGAYATYTILMSHLTPEVLQKWQQLNGRQSRIAQRWARVTAEAALAGQPLPALPPSANLGGPEIAQITQGWVEKSGLEVLAAVDTLPLDKQVGLVGGLAALPKWDDSLVQAQLTVVKVSRAADMMQGAKWEGRIFDESLRSEIASALRELALAGKTISVAISAAHPLSGVTVTMTEEKQKLPRAMLDQLQTPGLTGKPPADAAFYTMLRNSSAPPTQVLTLQPLWKDAELTASWSKEHGRPAQAASPATPAPGPRDPRRFQSNPAEMAAQMGRISAGEVAILSAFEFACYASPLGDEPGQ